MKIKLSDYVAQFLAAQGIRHVFAVSGGASLHLIHSLADTPGIEFICPQHEQAGAMAADAYSRVTGNLGAAVATSGPGATNMITGICCAYYDSVPAIYVTGQVSTFRFKGDTGVRQMGFQETEVVEMVAPVTKYAVKLTDASRIRYELEKACYIAKAGRPGPVLVDIPDNLQRAQIDPNELESFVPETVTPPQTVIAKKDLDRCIELIKNARRPVLVLGWGVRLAKGEEAVREFARKLGFPVLPTWAVLDLMPSDDQLVVGAFGTHGTRYGNFAIQNADLIFSVGARLDTRATGGFDTFGREAKKVVVDVDPSELNKFKSFGLDVDVLVKSDARAFLEQILPLIDGVPRQDLRPWFDQIALWKQRYPICKPEYYEEKELNPYVFVKTLSKETPEDTLIVVDTGCSLAWMSQAFEFKTGQRLLHDFNNTAMGYALPAAIAACFALDRRPVLCVTGDGSLLMNIQELATVQRHNLPVKVFLVNNHGHSMIQQTQDQWLDSRYFASSVAGGLASPDFNQIAEACGFKTFTITENQNLASRIEEIFRCEGPVFCNLEMNPVHRVIPQVKYGRALEDAEPLLERKEFFSNMLVAPDKASLPEESERQAPMVAGNSAVGSVTGV